MNACLASSCALAQCRISPVRGQLTLNLGDFAPFEEDEALALNDARGSPDERYVRDCYGSIMGLRDRWPDEGAVKDGIHGFLREIARNVDDNACGECSYTAVVVSLLMLHWTRKIGDKSAYEYHMAEHVEAIKVLARAWMKDRDFGRQRTIKIFDGSCGPGDVLEVFLDIFREMGILHKAVVVANDLSGASLASAQEKLKRFEDEASIAYTQYDLTRELPSGKFHLVLLSQSLCFICDEDALRDKRLGRALPSSEMLHIDAKARSLEALVGKVIPEKGELLIVDEDPMKLSEMPHDFDSIVEDTLFREIFREIPKGLLVNTVMKSLREARFMGHVESHIDRKHTMYLLSSTRSSRKDEDEEPDSQTVETDALIVEKLRGIHTEVVGRLQAFDDGLGVEYKAIPIDREIKTLFIDKDEYYSKIYKKPGYWNKNGSYDLIVISGLMHELGLDGYRRLIENLKASNKAGPGSAMIFIDQYPASEGENKVKNRDARGIIFNRIRGNEFIASCREGNRYGYLYVVRPTHNG